MYKKVVSLLINLYLNFKLFYEQRAKICGIININIFARINHTPYLRHSSLFTFQIFLIISFSSFPSLTIIKCLGSIFISLFYLLLSSFPLPFLHPFHYLSSILLLSSFSFILSLFSILFIIPLILPYFQFLTFLLFSYPTIFPILNLPSIILSYTILPLLILPYILLSYHISNS